MKVFELLPRPLGEVFRKLTHLTCNSPPGDGIPRHGKRAAQRAHGGLGD